MKIMNISINDAERELLKEAHGARGALSDKMLPEGAKCPRCSGYIMQIYTRELGCYGVKCIQCGFRKYHNAIVGRVPGNESSVLYDNPNSFADKDLDGIYFGQRRPSQAEIDKKTKVRKPRKKEKNYYYKNGVEIK